MTRRHCVIFLLVVVIQPALSLATSLDAETIAALEAARNGRCDDGLAHLQSVEASDALAEYSHATRVRILELISSCLYRESNFAGMTRYLETLVISEGEERPESLRLLIMASVFSEQWATGVDALARLAKFGMTEIQPVSNEFRFDYAVMSIDRGDVEDVKDIVLSLIDPGIILRVRVDRRYQLRERADVVAAANRVGRIEVVSLNYVVWHRY